MFNPESINYYNNINFIITIIYITSYVINILLLLLLLLLLIVYTPDSVKMAQLDTKVLNGFLYVSNGGSVSFSSWYVDSIREQIQIDFRPTLQLAHKDIAPVQYSGRRSHSAPLPSVGCLGTVIGKSSLSATAQDAILFSQGSCVPVSIGQLGSFQKGLLPR